MLTILFVKKVIINDFYVFVHNDIFRSSEEFQDKSVRCLVCRSSFHQLQGVGDVLGRDCIIDLE